MRPLTHSFLFCCPLRTGGVLVAIVHMLASGLLLLVDGMYLAAFDQRFDAERRAGTIDGTVVEYNLEKILLLVDILIQGLGIIFALLLLLGSLRGKARLVLAWALFMLLAFVLYASRTLGLNLSGWRSHLTHSLSTLALVAVVSLYSMAAMMKLHQELSPGGGSRVRGPLSYMAAKASAPPPPPLAPEQQRQRI